MVYANSEGPDQAGRMREPLLFANAFTPVPTEPR